MRDDEFEAFAAAWTNAWELTGKTVSPNAILFAFECLRRFDLADVTAALSAHACDPDAGQFSPKPADVIRHLRGGKADRALLAFTKAFTAASHVGSYQSVVFDDPIIHAVLADMGGWVEFCQYDIGENGERKGFLEREFTSRYAGYALRPPTRFPRKLTGIFEAVNSCGGYAVPAPQLIGNREAAERVYLAGNDAPRLTVTDGVALLEHMGAPA